MIIAVFCFAALGFHWLFNGKTVEGLLSIIVAVGINIAWAIERHGKQ